MAGDPAPLAAVQAAVLKSAAGKQANDPNPAGSTQAGAVAQDLAVMADISRGYTEGVNQGTIVAQDQRAAQARRLAADHASAAAERNRQLALEQMQTGQMRLQGQAAAQGDQFSYEREAAQQSLAARRREADREDEDSLANMEAARQVELHARTNRSPQFQDALSIVMDGATSTSEALAIFDNDRRQGEPYTDDIDRSDIVKYAREYFRAVHGRAVNLRRLDQPREKQRPTTSEEQPSRRTGVPSVGEVAAGRAQGAGMRIPGTDYTVRIPIFG